MLTLKRSRYFTGSQCSSRNTGVMCSLLRDLVIRRAAQFCIRCNRSPEANLPVARFHSPGEMLLVPGLEESYIRHL